MKMVSLKVKPSEYLFFLSYMVYLIYFILMTSFYAQNLAFANYAVKLFCILLILINEIFNRTTKKSLASIMLIILFSVMALLIEASNIVFVLFFLYGARNIPFDRIARVSRAISLALLIFIILSAYMGIIPNYVGTRGNGIERAYLGFRYVLYGPTILFNITALTIYLEKSSIKWRTILLLLIMNLGIFIPTNARLSFSLSILLILAAVVLKLRPNYLCKKQLLCKAMIVSFVICFFVSVLLAVFYDSSIRWLRTINDFMGNRLAMSHAAFLQYSFGLLGQHIRYFGHGLDMLGQHTREQYLYVDNLYVQSLQTYGVFFAFFFLLLNTCALYRCYRTQQWHLMIIMTMLALRGLIDDLSLQLCNNTFWIPIGTLVLSNAHSRKIRMARKYVKEYN